MTHCYNSNGYNIVMDVESGAVHVTDDLMFSVITALQEHFNEKGVSFEDKEALFQWLSTKTALFCTDREHLAEAFNEVLRLHEDAQLFTETDHRERIALHNEETPIVKALCLNVAHDCNLRCRYCFADEGDYHGERMMMDEATGFAALDFLIQNSGNRRNLEVDFFGGEPLLNFKTVKKIVAYGRAKEAEHNKRFRFTITTNGLLLDEEKLSFINREMSNLVLSIDGRKEIHDAMRPDAAGAGSYDRILPKLLQAAKSRHQTNYYVRGTFTHHNTDFANDVLHLADLGFQQISVEPVVAPPETDYALRTEDIPVLSAQYDALARAMLSREKEGEGFHFFHFQIDLDGGPCVVKRLRGCGAGCDYLGVTPSGDLYPCHQFVGDPAFLMGNVFTGVTRTDIRERFSGCNVYAKEECTACFARHYCSGGCAANAYHFTGSINGVYDIGCALEKKRVECSIMLEAARAELFDREEETS